jgi:hypothetical protein
MALRVRALAVALLLGMLSLSVMPPAVARPAALLSTAALDQLLAPIALYPDSLLAQVLDASTTPLEIVQADRWARQRPGLEGEAAVDAALREGWSPAVTSLTAFPELLARLSEDLDWTQALGTAYQAHPQAVAERIQVLRQQAHAAGSLQSLQPVRVLHETQRILIQPAHVDIVYVPVYDTRVVYGRWAWPAYPPVRWSSPGTAYSRSPFYWGRGIHYRPRHVDHPAFYRAPRQTVIVSGPRAPRDGSSYGHGQRTDRDGRSAGDPVPRPTREDRVSSHRPGAWTAATARPPRETPATGQRPTATITRPGVLSAPPPDRAPPRLPSAWQGGLFQAPANPQSAPARDAPRSAAEGTRWNRSEVRAPVPVGGEDLHQRPTPQHATADAGCAQPRGPAAPIGRSTAADGGNQRQAIAVVHHRLAPQQLGAAGDGGVAQCRGQRRDTDAQRVQHLGHGGAGREAIDGLQCSAAELGERSMAFQGDGHDAFR